MSTATQPTEAKTAPKGLVTKLAEVMGAVDRVPKRGRNAFHGYDYATEADITQAVRAELASRHVMAVPFVEEVQWADLQRKNGVEKLCTVRVRFDFVDGDTGETLSMPMYGQGSDSGDKAIYKAMTGATKYALLKLFLIPTGDDPENEGDAKPQAPPAAPRQPAPAPAPAAAPASPPASGKRSADVKQAARRVTIQETPPEPPPPTEADMPPDVRVPSGSSEFFDPPEPEEPQEPPVLVPFGRNKGKPLTELSERDLRNTAEYVDKLRMDPAKANFRDENARLLKAVQREIQRR